MQREAAMETKQVVDEDMSRSLLVGLVCQAVSELRVMFPLPFITPVVVFGPLFLPDIVIQMSNV